MASVLVTGSSRGIGLEIVKQLLDNPKAPSTLIATCRNPAGAKDLQVLAEKHSNLHIIKLNVDDFDSYPDAVKQVEQIVGNKGLTVLINNAGILLKKKTSLSEVNAKDLADTLRTNTIAPIMVTKAFWPLLKRAAASNENTPIGWSRGAVLNISSGLGSISNNNSAVDFLEYRGSKAALNQEMRSISMELAQDNILVMMMHPGWVQTDMGTKDAFLKVEDSVSGMLKQFFALGPKQQGCFMQWDGQTLPW